MTGAQVIVLATPVFLLAIAAEFAVGLARGRNTYRLNDALGSIGLGVMSQVIGRLRHAVHASAMYTLVFEHVALLRAAGRRRRGSGSARCWATTSATTGCTAPATAWRVLWAAHVVHHQSEDYNLSTALRQTSSGFLLGWIFYLPHGAWPACRRWCSARWR